MLRIIGDLHGHKANYKKFVKGTHDSIQIGDLHSSYDANDLQKDYSWMTEAGVDPTKHKFFTGNHDNLDFAFESPHCLGDFGVYTVPDFGDVFFVRGAFSIDHKHRRKTDWQWGNKLLAKNHWPDKEELTLEECNQAIALYEQVKPVFVLTHECPLDVVDQVTDPHFMESMGYSQAILKTRTNQALNAMLVLHQPKVWCFGHYHRKKSFVHGETNFHCIGLNQFKDFGKYPS